MNEDLAYQLQLLSVSIVQTQEALQQLNLQAYGLAQRVMAQGIQVPMMQQMAPQQVAGFSHAPRVGGLSQSFATARLATQDSRLSQTAAKAADAQQARGLGQAVGNLKPDLGGRVPGGAAGAHVNSGPTHHTDNGGFSDFTSRFQNPADQLRNPGNLAGAHVNSGPTHHTDNGGFSDFMSRFQNPADQLRNPGGAAGAHVNSGPTHHTDNGGFSDFTSQFQNPATQLGNPAVRIGDTQVRLADNQSLRLGGYLLTKVRG